jgi:DNA-binding PadR family transcriptional regulator
LTHNLPKTGAEIITKYESLALEIKNIWKLNNVSIYPLVVIAEG